MSIINLHPDGPVGNLSSEDWLSAYGNTADGARPVGPTFKELLEKLKDAKTVRELLTEEVKAAYLMEGNREQRALMEADLLGIARRGKYPQDFKSVFGAFKKDLEAKEKALRTEWRAAHAQRNNINFDDLDNPYPELCSYTYDINDDGVFLEGEQICTQPVMIFESSKNIESKEVYFYITFWDGRSWRTLSEKRETLFSPAKIISLASYGLSVHGENAKKFIKFLDVFESENRERLAPKLSFSRLGWFGKNQFAPYEPDMVFSGQENQDLYDSVKEAGSLEAWIVRMHELRKNPVFRMAMAASFASPLLKKAGINPFVFHLWGPSGTGKTVSLMAAASIWGDPQNGGLLKTVNSTTNYAVNLAAFFCSVPVFLDELQTMSKNDWSSIETFVMAITEGIERGRMSYNEARPARRWNCCFMISGEQPIVKENSKAGFFNRVIEINCNTKLMADGNREAEFVRANYGHAGKVYIGHIKNMASDIPELFRQQMAEILQQIQTTDKQAAAMAAMMLAERLAGECLFTGEVPLSVEDVRPFLREVNNVDDSNRAYEYICGVIAANPAHFDTSGENRYELWGKIEGSVCTFNKVKLLECLEAGGFNFDAVKRGWHKKGLLIKNTQNKYVHDASYYGIKALSVRLILPHDAEQDEYLPL